jgi:FkbM family methyltransferase
MLTFLKRVIAALPLQWQQELKRRHYRRQIERGTFVTNEPEYAILDSLIVPGSLIVDVGANVGHYTKKFSDLAGPDGRVIAFEPVPETFSILAANVSLFQFHNVSLLNAAASDGTTLANIQVPRFETGLRNWYEASMTSEATGLQVMTLALDALQIPQTVCLVKIDAEGHELQVLHGMKNLLRRDHPILIVEANSESTVKFLESMSYTGRRLPNSPNILFE